MADFIDDAINAADISITVSTLENNSYKCDFNSAHHSMTRTITMAEGYGPPMLANMIYFYATEIQLYEDCDDILEWSKDMALDPGDAITLKRYNQLAKDHTDLRLLLGEENYQTMITALEISQTSENTDPEQE